MSIKRLRYFSGQFLKAEDFTDEQGYHRDMRRRHNAKLHTYGVVEGLEVSATAVEYEVEISNGWAIDVDGHEIVLASSDPVTRTLTGDSPWYITCSLKETTSVPQPVDETGIAGDRRIDEDADILVAGAVPANALGLARITLDVGDNLEIEDIRHFSGMNLPGKLIVQGDLEVQGNTTIMENEQMQGNVTLGDEDVDTVTVEGRLVTGHSSGNLEIGSPVNVTGGLVVSGQSQLGDNTSVDGAFDVTGAAQIGGNLTVQGNLDVQGNTTLVQTDKMRGEVVLGDEDTDTVTVEGTMLTGHSSGNLEIGSPVNVTGGITVNGDTELTNNAEVAGTLNVRGATQVGGNLTVQGNLEVQGDTTVVHTDRMRGNVILGDEDTDTITLEGRMVSGHSSGNLEFGSSVHVSGDLGANNIIVPGAVDGRDVSADGANLDSHLAFNSSSPGNPHGVTPDLIGALKASDYDIAQGHFTTILFTESAANGAQRTVTLGFKPRLLWVSAGIQAYYNFSGGSRYMGADSVGFADLRGSTFQQLCTSPTLHAFPSNPFVAKTYNSASVLCYANFINSTNSLSIQDIAIGVRINSITQVGSNWQIVYSFIRNPPSTTTTTYVPFSFFNVRMSVCCLGT